VGVVAIIGSGAAGLQAALAARRNGADVVICSDRGLGQSNSVLAQGGMQYPVDEASEHCLAADMIAAGGTPPDPDRLRTFVGHIRPMVAELIGAGLELDHDEDGSLIRRRAGGMSEPRVVTSGDRIGAPVMRLLLRQVRDSDIEIREHVTVEDVGRRGAGLVVSSGSSDIAADAVVAATGGRAWSWASARDRPTSNPPNGNDRLFAALTAHAELATVDPDEFQYQPFGDVRSLGGDGVGKLIPESIAAAGVRILDRRGVEVVDPLAGRRTVTAAMHERLRAGLGVAADNGIEGLRLTLSDLDPDWVARHYPTLHRRLSGRGDAGDDQIVAPFVHYQLGGLAVRPDGSTTLPGLYLAGEITGGLHGHNRLMGNGLTEALVGGRLAGAAAAEFSRR